MGLTQDISASLRSSQDDWSRLSPGGKRVIAGGVLAAALGAALCARSVIARSIVRFVVWAGAGAAGALALLTAAKLVTDGAGLKISPRPEPAPEGGPRAGSVRLRMKAVVDATLAGLEHVRPTSVALSQRARLNGTLVVLQDGKMVVGGPLNYRYDLDPSEEKVHLQTREIVTDEGTAATELQFSFGAEVSPDRRIKIHATSRTHDELNHVFWVQAGTAAATPAG